MTCGFVPVRRIAALSVAITLFAAPIASAQTPEAVQPAEAPTNTALLSPAAFARLVQPPATDVAPAPVVADSPRINLLRPVIVAKTHAIPAAPAPQQRSWVARHKVATGVLIGVGVVVGFMLIYCSGSLGAKCSD